MPGPTDGKTFTPIDSVTYRLRAENLLTSLSPTLFGATWDIPVEVAGVLPGVIFTGTTSTGSVNAQTRTITIVRGQSVTLLWTVVRTDELFLLTNDAPQTIAPEQYTSSIVVQPEADTTYKLAAHNHYTGAGGYISDPITVRVVGPSATPLPVPVIERFDVQPTVITVGESVKLDWLVTGVDKVTITGVDGDLSPTGSIEVAPAEPGTVFFKLTATNGAEPVILQRQVVVQAAPTATAEPLAPKIEFFTVTPAEVVAGSPEANGVLLAWSVTGATTNISISGPDFGEVANLDRTGHHYRGGDGADPVRADRLQRRQAEREPDGAGERAAADANAQRRRRPRRRRPHRCRSRLSSSRRRPTPTTASRRATSRRSRPATCRRIPADIRWWPAPGSNLAGARPTR